MSGVGMGVARVAVAAEALSETVVQQHAACAEADSAFVGRARKYVERSPTVRAHCGLCALFLLMDNAVGLL